MDAARQQVARVVIPVGARRREPLAERRQRPWSGGVDLALEHVSNLVERVRRLTNQERRNGGDENIPADERPGLGRRQIRLHHRSAPRRRSFVTTLPPFITNFTRCNSVMSARGSPATAMRSANFPLSIEPTRSCHPNTSALTVVPLWIALAGLRPAIFTSASKSSAWVPCGYVDPSTPLPIITLSPGVAAARAVALPKIGMIRYFPPVFFASVSSILGSV